MEKIIFIRHGETDTNTKGIIHQVQDREVLNTLGIKQMEQVTEVLKHTPPDKIYSSNEHRTIESAEIIARAFGLTVETLPELGERDWGDFVGRPWSEVEAMLNKMKLEERYTYIPPYGESWQSFERRLVRGVKNILENNKNKNIAIVSHGGAIRALMPYLLNKPKEESFKYDPANASVTVFEHQDGKFTLVN